MKQEFAFQPGSGGLAMDHKPLFDILHRHSGHSEPTKDSVSVPIDVKECESEVIVFADLPGVDEDDIHIDLESNILMITTEREFDHDNEDPEEYVVLERAYGPVQRAINVPGLLDKSGMTAKYKRGVLKIRIPKIRARVQT